MTNPMAYASFALSSYIKWLEAVQKSFFPENIETPFDWLKPVSVKDN